MKTRLPKKPTTWEVHDERTRAQVRTHRYGVAAVDTFLSGWGKAEGGLSLAVWCTDKPDLLDCIRDHVGARGDSKEVRVVDLHTWHPGNACKHLSIYVVDAEHRYSQPRAV